MQLYLYSMSQLWLLFSDLQENNWDINSELQEKSVLWDTLYEL